MKNLVLKTAIVAILLLSAASCSKVKSSLEFSVPIVGQPLEFTYKSSPIPTPMPLTATAAPEVVILDKTLDTRVSETLKDKGLSPAGILKFTLSRVEITLKSPENFDMNIFKGMKLYIGDLSELAAEVEKISDDKRSLILRVVQENIPKYLNQDKLRVVIKAPLNPDTPIVDPVTLILKTAFRASFKPF